jgi:hypothetical protein
MGGSRVSIDQMSIQKIISGFKRMGAVIPELYQCPSTTDVKGQRPLTIDYFKSHSLQRNLAGVTLNAKEPGRSDVKSGRVMLITTFEMVTRQNFVEVCKGHAMRLSLIRDNRCFLVLIFPT